MMRMLMIPLLLISAQTFSATSSMGLVDSSGYSVYESSMGGSQPYYGLAEYKVKAITPAGNGQYQVALDGAGVVPDVDLKVGHQDAVALHAGDQVKSLVEVYGLRFEEQKTKKTLAIIALPSWDKEMHPHQVS